MAQKFLLRLQISDTIVEVVSEEKKDGVLKINWDKALSADQ